MSMKPLLDTYRDDNEDASPVSFVRSIDTTFISHKYILVVHAIFIAINATIFFIYTRSLLNNGRLSGSNWDLLPLPAHEALKPELRTFKTSLIDNPFAGPPRPKLDEAWHNLLKNDNIKIPESSLHALDLTSIHVEGSSEVLASLSAFHALHCLKKIRQMTYKEYYHANKSSAAMTREIAHSDHCIEYVREYITCKPDLSFITYHWINDTAQHPDEPQVSYPTTWDHALHECANWEAVDAWAGERRIDLWDYELLERPNEKRE
ncbi:hypothetical protein MMC10_004029 [Thelotrema lepadinum]|nr:hypothetical protein [Thelotrema lepadinum]